MLPYADALTLLGSLLGSPDLTTDQAVLDALAGAVVLVDDDGTSLYSAHLAAANYLDGIIVQSELAAAAGGRMSGFASEGSEVTFAATDLTGLRRLAARFRRAAAGGVSVINLGDPRRDEPPRSTYGPTPRPVWVPHVR